MLIADMNSKELLLFVEKGEMDEKEAIEILRNPFCTAEVAKKMMEGRRRLSAHRVRELLCRIRGMPTPTLIDLISGLPWLSLLHLAQEAQTPPMVRRRAELRLLQRIPRLSTGERVALARRAHRELYLPLLELGEVPVINALLDNPRLRETDFFSLLQQVDLPAFFFGALIRHPRWACRRELRRAMARCKRTPLPLALSALAELGLHELRDITLDASAPAEVRDAALQLIKKRELESS